jgi:hypothetical protein
VYRWGQRDGVSVVLPSGREFAEWEQVSIASQAATAYYSTLILCQVCLRG